MFKKKSILTILIAVLALLCLTLTAEAAKGGGGCKDRDGDGYFQKDGCGTAVDCDDSNAAVNPDAVEVCDSIDNNCDGTVDEGCGGCTDNDGDGYGVNGDPSCLNSGIDCDDADPNTYPGAPLLCDAKDNDCDGSQDFPTDEDKDGDGVPWCAGDCDDNNANISPDLTEGPFGDPTCSDGIDNDCDNLADGADNECACTDNDLDGYGNGPFCLGPDCDDTDPSINPGASEICNDNVDNNCDGNVDEDCGGCIDNDADGFGNGPDCLGPDCDDTDAAVNPWAPEVCDDGIDNNCDGTVDEGCSGCIPTAAKEKGCDCFDNTDNDCDGSTDSLDRDCRKQTCDTCFDNDGDSWYDCGNDCDDNNPAINPGAPEVCNGIDDNCDGSLPAVESDIDGDGVSICEGDCDDNNPNRSPGNIEEPIGSPVCADGIDNDCDELIDTGDPGCDNQCIDNDGDGFGVNGDPNCPYPFIIDCDDTDPTINPLGTDLCDGIDRDCNGTTINDDDADGFGVPASSTCTYNVEDCDDTDPTINPLGTDLCDGIDRDCNGTTINDDDADGFGVPASSTCTYNVEDCDDTDPTINPLGTDLCDGIDRDCNGTTINDDDADGFGVPASSTCTYNVEDCDDTDPTINPLGTDLCDGIDRDCNGTTINDDDADGFGVPASSTCTYNVEDCDDTDPTINPLGTDLCDGIDRDCNGTTINDDDADGFGVPASSTCTYNVEDCDDTDPLVNPFGIEGPSGDPTCSDTRDNDCDNTTDGADNDCAPTICDPDGDGYCDCPECIGVDCDDYDPNVYPGAPPICDGKDSNCDGQLDFPTDVDMDTDGVPLCAGDCNDNGPACCDNDGDGYGNLGGTDMCSGGLDVDCDDNNPNVNPGAAEGPSGDPTCFDGIDNDCSGQADAADVAACSLSSCVTKSNPKDGPHVENLMDPGPDGLPYTADDIIHTDNITLLCGKCHGATLQDPIRDQCERCHAAGGVTKALYPDPWPFGFGSAPNVQMHSSLVVGTKYGNWDMECKTCHNPHLQEQNAKHGTSYGMYIKEYICFDNQVTGLNIEEIIEFTAPSGPGSFSDGPPFNENICEMCHTQTMHHQNDGTAPGGQSHNDGTDCTSCHTHDDGFVPIVECFGPHDTVTDCNMCHVSANFTDPIPNIQCDQCHTASGSLKVSYPAAPDVETHQGNSFSFSIDCVECHTDHCYDNGINLKLVRSTIAGSVVPGSQIVFTSYTGPGSFADGPPFEENICNTCHTMTSHHQADGIAPGGQDHNTADDCTQCHSHLPNGFFPTF